jgi:hypothetical protein
MGDGHARGGPGRPRASLRPFLASTRPTRLGAEPCETGIVRSTREVGAAETFLIGEHARRVHLSLEGVPEDLPRLGRRLPGIVHRVELERPDPAREAELGWISRPSIRQLTPTR